MTGWLPFDAGFDFEQVPAASGVFLLDTGGEPYLNKSANLRRRLLRLLGPEEPGSKRLNLRTTTRALQYQLTGSAFETTVTLWQEARRVFPDSYRQRLRLRPPVMLKLNLDNEYPRCYPTRRLGRGPAQYFGPFPSRQAAERFAAAFLDLFKIRRCVETIRPDPAHPGCIYGEMNMCLRPCQAAVSAEEYRQESERVRDFLATQGDSVRRPVETERDLLSANMDFEQAAQLHKRLEKIEGALDAPELARKGGLAMDLERLHGVVVQRSALAGAVELFPVFRGFLLPRLSFSVAPTADGRSLDARLRETLAAVPLRPRGRRIEHLAILAKWFYRGSRQGELVVFESFEKPAYRRLVNAIGRVSRGEAVLPVV